MVDRVVQQSTRTPSAATVPRTERLLARRHGFLHLLPWILGALFAVTALLVALGQASWIDQWAVDHAMPALRPRSIPQSAGKTVFPIFHVRHGMNLPVAAAVYSDAWIASAAPALLLTTAGCLYLVRRRRRRVAIYLAAAFVAVAVAELAAKSLVGRPALYGTDPRGVRVKIVPFDTSFFSGHAARAVLLAALLAICARRLRWAAVVWLASVVVLLVVGGWHTPSDVLGALLLAGAFAVPALLEDRRGRNASTGMTVDAGRRDLQ